MKVLYITNIPSPYRVAFFKELGRYCELTVIYDRASASDREQVWMKGTDTHDLYKSVVLNGIKVKHDLAFSTNILSWLKKEYDHIIIGVYSSPTAMLAIEYLRFKKIPFILNADGGFIKNDNILARMVKRHFIGSASAWLGTGFPTAEYLEHYGGVKNRIFEYPFTSLFKEQLYLPAEEQRKSMKTQLGFRESRLVLAVGRFIPLKGLDLLIKAGKHLSEEIGIVIVGGIPSQDYVDMAEINHPDHVHFVDFKVWEELRNYYVAADVFVFPTKGDVWGLVVNEAMAFGLPVISSIHSIAGKVLVRDGDTGYLVDPEDIEKMAGYIQEVLLNPGMAERMGANAFCRIQEYTIEQMTARHLEVLSALGQSGMEIDKHECTAKGKNKKITL